MCDPGESVCGARGGSQPGAGAACGPRIEPLADGEAAADRGGDGVADGRGRGSGDGVPAAGCAEPVASVRWSADSKRGCACVPCMPGIDTGKRPAVWDGC